MWVAGGGRAWWGSTQGSQSPRLTRQGSGQLQVCFDSRTNRRNFLKSDA